jgi:hypothetical protein
VATSYQWSDGYNEFLPIFWTSVAFIFNGWTIYYLAKYFHRLNRNCWRERANLILLIVIVICMLKIGINRADANHVVRTLWMPAIAFLYMHGKSSNSISIVVIISIFIAIIALAFNSENYWFFLLAVIPVLVVIKTKLPKLSNNFQKPNIALVAFVIPLFIASIFKCAFNFSQNVNGYQWIPLLFAPPINNTMVSESINWVSAEIQKTSSHCVFDLSNNGVINGVTSLPACTKYTYPIYAIKRYQVDMIQELVRSNPPVVVFSSTHWAFSIDGKSMHDRLPELKNYLLKAYPYESCNFGYCLRFINKPV